MDKEDFILQCIHANQNTQYNLINIINDNDYLEKIYALMEEVYSNDSIPKKISKFNINEDNDIELELDIKLEEKELEYNNRKFKLCSPSKNKIVIKTA
nr:MAG TPA: hypothetical protein [Caudoviricetes sp.]